MSGGVDSSVAAALLKKQGYEVIGAHMRCYNVDGCAEQDAEDARRAAEILGIPFYTFDFEQEYKDKVVNYMVDGYRKGITPNPDVMCNKEIKFGLFLKKALEMGADYVATGHYVRLAKMRHIKRQPTRFFVGNIPQAQFARSPKYFGEIVPREKKIRPLEADYSGSHRNSGLAIYRLLIAKDTNKDQSYFLWTLTQKQLKHCLFPIGDYKKPQVRKLAQKFGLLNANKKDSQGICFLGKVSLADFLKQYIPEKRGAVLNTAGKKIGEHSGAHFYTIGQRRLGIKKLRLGAGSNTKPHYVSDKNIKTNVITIAGGENNPELYKKTVVLTDINLIESVGNLPIAVRARVRYRQPLAVAVLNKLKTNYQLVFKVPQKFIAQGQSAVFYDKKGVMLGGGIIKSVL